MPTPQKLDESQIQSALTQLPHWTLAQGKLHREYKFADFIHAFGFMATSAIAIEKMNHHPEWFNVGIIGVGGMGFAHVRMLKPKDGVQITAVSDIYSERKKRAREFLGLTEK